MHVREPTTSAAGSGGLITAVWESGRRGHEDDECLGSDQNASTGNAMLEAMTGGYDDGDRSEDEWGDALKVRGR